MNFRDLRLRILSLVRRSGAERELGEELAFHIEREIHKQVAAGLSPAAARSAALVKFGSVALAADGCRDARGTGTVDALGQDIRYAFRTLRHAPLAAITIVATVGLGLALVAVVFTVFSALFLQPDAVRDPDALVSLERPPRDGSRAFLPFTVAEYEMLRRDGGDYVEPFAMLRYVPARVGGSAVTGALVSGNAFQVLGVSAALGRTLQPADDHAAAAQTIVLSDRAWRGLFAADPAVIGRQMRINGVPWDIVGVMPADFRGLAIGPPDFWAALAQAGRFRTDAVEDIAVDVIGRLEPGVSPEAAASGLTQWAVAHPGMRRVNGLPLAIRLRPRPGAVRADLGDALLGFSPLFVAFGLILLIGCANVANLQLARGIARQRELGIRLALGGSRRRILWQLLTENILLALAAAACALAVLHLFLRGILAAIAATVPPELIEFVGRFEPAIDWRVAAFLLAGAVVSMLMFGLAPSLQATRLELVRTIRGEVTRDARPRRARHVLMSMQVGAAAVLLICAGVFLRSAAAAATLDPGVRTGDTVRVSVRNESGRAALLQAAATHPLVSDVSAASFRTLAVLDTNRSNGTGSRRVAVDRITAAPNYFELLGLSLVRGRYFTAAERSEDAGVAILSESVAQELWPAGDAVGQVVTLEVSASSSPAASASAARTVTVVGVLRDVAGPLAVDLFPPTAIYVPTIPENPGSFLLLRVRGNPEQARQALIADLSRADPGLGEVATMQTIAALPVYLLRTAFTIVAILAGVALVLTVSGLFSVLSYVIEQSLKEIAVRMALGATTRRVAELVLTYVMRPVGWGLLAGCGLAAAIATALRATPAAGDIGNVVDVLDPVAYAAGVLIIVIASLIAASVPAVRALRVDPMITLRNE